MKRVLLFIVAVIVAAPVAAQQWYQGTERCMGPGPFRGQAHAVTLKNIEYAIQWITNDGYKTERVLPVFGEKVRYDGGAWQWRTVARFYVTFELAGSNGWKTATQVANGHRILGRAADGSVEIGRFEWLVPFVWDASNPEALVKFLDPDPGNDDGHFWLFAAAATDLPARIRVWDEVTGLVYVWSRGRGPAAALVSTGDIIKSRPHWCR